MNCGDAQIRQISVSHCFSNSAKPVGNDILIIAQFSIASMISNLHTAALPGSDHSPGTAIRNPRDIDPLSFEAQTRIR
jgi:uncharacterized protein YfdQ (DUF2303 family)